MKITRTKLPITSILSNTDHKKYDYVDCFQGELTTNKHTVTPTDICAAFLSAVPGWAMTLLALRNRIVAIVGLKVTGGTKDTQQWRNFKWEPGTHLGILNVLDKTDREALLGADDKHLNFKISLLLGKQANASQTLTISTVVNFNNWFGRFYFFFVAPFHRAIVRATLKATIRKLAERKV